MDNTGLVLCLFKNGQLVSQGTGNTVTLITNQDIQAGEYKVAFTDGTVLSDFTDVPAIKLTDTVSVPTNITIKADKDEATVSAE